MKTTPFFTTVFFLFLLFILGCKPDPEPQPSPLAEVQEPTELTETGFICHWTINRDDVSHVTVEVSLKNDFIDLVKSITISDPSQKSQEIDGLHGATMYFVRIKADLSDGTHTTSNSRSIRTKYQTEDADVTTTDGIHIDGNLYYLNSNPAKSPAVILSGEFSISNMWKGTNVFHDLLAQGYICYIYSYRGHGASDAWSIFEIQTVAELQEFVSVYARDDLHACYTYLKGHEKVDSTRIVLMGGSLGANESLIGNNWPGVKASVSLTPSLLGIEEGGTLQNILLLVSELDYNSAYDFYYKDQAQIIYNAALEPKKMVLVQGDFHGLQLLGVENNDQEIMDWINARIDE